MGGEDGVVADVQNCVGKGERGDSVGEDINGVCCWEGWADGGSWGEGVILGWST